MAWHAYCICGVCRKSVILCAIWNADGNATLLHDLSMLNGWIVF